MIAVNMKNANGVILVVAVEFLHNPVINYITPCTCSGRWATIQLKTWVASTASFEVRPKSAKSRTVVAVIVRVARVAALPGRTKQLFRLIYMLAIDRSD